MGTDYKVLLGAVGKLLESATLCPHTLMTHLVTSIDLRLSCPPSPQKTPHSCEVVSVQKHLGCASSVGFLCSEPRRNREERKGARWVWRREKPRPSGRRQVTRGLFVPLGRGDQLIWGFLLHVIEALPTLLMGVQVL